MIYLRKFHSLSFLTSSITSKCFNSPTPHQFSQFSSSFWRPFSANSVTKKPLGVFFQEAVGLIEKSEQQAESEGEAENKEVKCRLRKLEEEVRSLREKRENGVLGNEGKSKKLHELFVNEEVKSVKSSENGNGVLGNEGKSKRLHELFVNDEVKSVKSSEKRENEKSRNGNGVLGNERKSKKLHELCVNEEVKSVKSSEKRENENSRNGNGVLGNEGKSKKLHELFGNEGVKSVKSRKSKSLSMEDYTVYKELSNEMVMFLTHLYNEGYFKGSNFLSRKKFDIACFDNSYARDFVKYAAEQFGKDHQEIAKWLSGSELKKVALFGCPSTAKKTVFSAKTLRTYFRIQEDNVCSKCALKASCKFVNRNVGKGDMTNLQLAVVMRVIILYALESVPPQLVIPDEIKACVNLLLMDILRLSQTVEPGVAQG